jgi:diacylglycerol kinase (ATP)
MATGGWSGRTPLMARDGRLRIGGEGVDAQPGEPPASAGLLPEAEPDDGVLDVAVLAARGWTGWLRLAAAVLLGRRTGRLARLACRDLVVVVSRARPWQVDGEAAGLTPQRRVTLQPGKLLLRVPAERQRAGRWSCQRLPGRVTGRGAAAGLSAGELLSAETQPCAY